MMPAEEGELRKGKKRNEPERLTLQITDRFLSVDDKRVLEERAWHSMGKRYWILHSGINCPSMADPDMRMIEAETLLEALLKLFRSRFFDDIVMAFYYQLVRNVVVEKKRIKNNHLKAKYPVFLEKLEPYVIETRYEIFFSWNDCVDSPSNIDDFMEMVPDGEIAAFMSDTLEREPIKCVRMSQLKLIQ